MQQQLAGKRPARRPSPRPQPGLAGYLRANIAMVALLALLVITGAAFTLASDNFLTARNFLNIIRQASPSLIVAVAMTMVITTRGIDLSVGSLTAMIGGFGALLFAAGWGAAAVIVAMCLIGLAAGAVNGFFVAYQGVPAFIVTLAGYTAFRGVALIVTQGYSIPIRDERFVAIGQSDVGGIPIPALIALATGAIGWIVFNKTPYGMRIVAVGSNPEATRRSGVNTALLIASVYVVSGLSAAIAAVVIAARLAAGSSNAGIGLELEVITGVVLGGTSLFGGVGTIAGSLLGVFLIAMIGNGLILLHLDPFYVPVVQGAILLAALWLYARFGKAGLGR